MFRRLTIFTITIILFTIFTIKPQPILAICGNFSPVPPICTYPNFNQENIPPAVQCNDIYTQYCCESATDIINPTTNAICIQETPTVTPQPTTPPGSPTNTPIPTVIPSNYDCSGPDIEIYISGSLTLFPTCNTETATITINTATPEDPTKTVDVILQPPYGQIETVGSINVQTGNTIQIRPSTGWFGNGEQYIVYLQSNARCSPNVNLEVRGCNAFPTPSGGCGGVNIQCGAENDPPCCTDQNLICDHSTNPFTCQEVFVPPTPTPHYDPCTGVGDSGPPPTAEYTSCNDCIQGINTYANRPGAWTAFGCFPTDPSGFATFVIKILFGIAGGVAFLLIIYGAFLCITSNGDPQKVQACKETITSAIVGLIMLIFALFIIRIIFGPGFGIIPNLVPSSLFP